MVHTFGADGALSSPFWVVLEETAVELIRARTQRDAEVEERELEIAFTKRQMERAENLYKKKAIPFREKDAAATDAARAELQLRQTRHQLRVAELELQRARKQLDLRTIRTPITGVVVQRLLAVGESVENLPIVRIAQVDPLNVEVIMPVTHYGSIDFGMQARVQPKFPGASEVTATVTVIDRVVDAASNTFGVRLELANPDYRIPGGVRCEIEFLQ